MFQYPPLQLTDSFPHNVPFQLPPSIHFSSQPRAASKSSAPSRHSSTTSTPPEDLLTPGDIVGEGSILQAEPIRLVSIGSMPRSSPAQIYHQEPAKQFKVIRLLGHGSYAVVYLVQELLYRPPPSEHGHMETIGFMDLDPKPPHPEHVYGREYAIKCLSKANLDNDALAAQLSEVTIHQSLNLHPNIVSLHRTLESSSFLLLLLEYVPGEDLFYFLEQARDHYTSDLSISPDSSVSRTPPTPSLLSNLHPSQLLSPSRLRLISSMFAQMCDAVAACHQQHVFHRDIKPENFIVTDGWLPTPDARFERKVVVKLSDFGLSTTDLVSSDMDCGSAPYMSYECRNNIAPTYRPRAADVWSLGIVLINMLYHHNPWTDTAHGVCSSFDLYRRDPVNFFLCRFTGMTRLVAEHFAHKVFCILDDPEDDSRRISASDFGAWARNLPALLGPHGIHRTVSNSSTQGHLISSSIPLSHRPSSRNPSGSTSPGRTPAMPQRSLSRAPSLGPAYEREEPSALSTVFDQELEEQDEHEQEQLGSITSRSTSTNKRRKRGTRKGKGAAAVATPTTSTDHTLTTLAVASQSLAREISKASKSSSANKTVSSKTSASSSTRRNRQPFEPVSIFPVPAALCAAPRNTPRVPPRAPRAQPPAPTPAPQAHSLTPSPVTKKPSKWKLSFGKNTPTAAPNGPPSPVDEVQPQPPSSAPPMSQTASNVTNIIMGLNAPAPPSASPSLDESTLTWTRGRRARGSPGPSDQSSGSPTHRASQSPNSTMEHWAFLDRRSDRAISPNSTRPVASSASSVVSNNWRSSMSTTSSAGTSSSALTRYSNSSMRSVSTTATSVSSTSWRTSVKPTPQSPTNHAAYPSLPKNIKSKLHNVMNGVPWELDQLPRGLNPHHVGDIFGSPPVRKQRTRKPKDLKLDTITERPLGSGVAKSPDHLRQDASTSTTDLGGLASGRDDGDGFKKVQKGQITTLAKMLSALRR